MMKYSTLCVVFIFLQVIPTFASNDRCKVLEISHIHSPAEITCRVERWHGVDRLKLRVFVKDLVVLQAKQQEAMNWLAQIKNQPAQITLINIQDRNYFRVYADMKINGLDLKAHMKSLGFLVPDKTSSSDLVSPEQKPGKASRFQVSVDSASRSRAMSQTAVRTLRPIKRKPRVSVERLLQTQIDCSSLTQETTLSEAIQHVREAFNPNLPILVLWNDLEQNSMISHDTPIGLGGMSTLGAGQALDLILRAVSTAGTTRPIVVADHYLIVIGMPQTIKPRPTTRIYSIPQLTQPPIQIYGQHSGQGLGSSTTGFSGSQGGYSGQTR